MTEEVQSKIKDEKAVVEDGWAASAPVNKDIEDKKPKQKESFVSRLIPKSKQGKVVFAAATAQVASMVVVPLLWTLSEGVGKKQLDGLAGRLAKIFDKRPKIMGDVLNSVTWDGLFDPDEREKWETAKGNDRHKLQAAKFISMGLQGVFNITSTMWVRNKLDKKLGINAGKKAVAKTQMLDSAVAMGALLAIPRFQAPRSERWRMSARRGYRKLGDAVTFGSVEDKSMQRFAKNAAFYTVNIGIPDALGFLTGLTTMLGELDEKAAKLEEREKQQSKPEGITIAQSSGEVSRPSRDNYFINYH